jgi:hypothetical protein
MAPVVLWLHKYSIAINQVVTVILSKWRILGSVASLLAATLFHWNHEKNDKFWNIVSTNRCIPHIKVMLESCYL